MCGICGCGQPHGHQGLDESAHAEEQESGHQRRLQVELDLFSQNNRYAQANRELFQRRNLLVLNLVSSPGSGKTALLTRTLQHQLDKVPLAVIEGDQQTSHDADRIRETGAEAVQLNTGRLCHLDAHMVGHAMEQLPHLENGLLYIENVGNLVCPAGFDLGEAAKVVVLSVTEGDDKPLKYPDMFHAARLMVLNKVDLLPYVNFDVEACIEYARRINPEIEVITLSAQTGEGMENWLEWIEHRRQGQTAARVAQLERELLVLKSQL
ncbi:hydrogenase nickel incorporation protein HypB [Marinobacterium sediminicola]|uniref:Hydrogenase maturation factor HypB n=1 Tax=Marinobacterium sediminicola TaxID=518898 RepID=A0ABY1RXD8_9GAMM|nr:hydrogenase nickel incorporation protein HypB [Marinobacterium sediminicola]ULG67766.1 hydrogenase nickel incorporation protein HypB [Marinobacterium sediminicola]SMR71584.1 hydrogenase nickel incorporation protein HypB [Marinobacterium sediminicola]